MTYLHARTNSHRYIDHQPNSHSHNRRATLAACLSVVAAIALTSGEAHATGYSGHGWAQHDLSAGASASAEFASYDFGIGYSAHAGVEGYNWDIAPNTVSVSCVAYEVDMGIFTITIQFSRCPTLPGTKLSTNTTSTPTTYQGRPAVRKTTTVVWDVPDSGAAVRVDGSFQVPVTLFSESFNLIKVTGTGAGNTSGADTLSGVVDLAGAKIAVGQATLPVSRTIAEKCGQVVDLEAPFGWWIFTIDVGTSLDGCVAIDANASFTNRTLTGTLTPRAEVDATFSVGVSFDIYLASAEIGLAGNLTVVDARLPVSLSAAVLPMNITLTESARLTMTGLDGHLALHGEGCVFGECRNLDWVIFDWNGLTFVNTTIFSATQSFPYAGPQDPG